MSEFETWYVLTDGSYADPSECASDDKGVLRSKEGVAVAIKTERGDPKTSSVDAAAERAKRKNAKAEESEPPKRRGRPPKLGLAMTDYKNRAMQSE